MARYYIEPKTRKYVKGYGYFSFARNLSDKYKKKFLITNTKIDLHASKVFPKNYFIKIFKQQEN